MQGGTIKPQTMNPLKKIPLDLKELARAKNSEALNHCCLVQHSIPGFVFSGEQDHASKVTYLDRKSK